ncbi:hypothetical protein CCHR01_01037 [Colletotrichum chrysophilum]|uniref:Oxidase ustYa n=1 Tax=Colletotrichum chrysophilum TaxID=1836956 RepID=A0AAD9ELK4_9PEZI|nr:hypothetical protein CCHR01_01037 [Colletotrichum chrysophilum]
MTLSTTYNALPEEEHQADSEFDASRQAVCVTRLEARIAHLQTTLWVTVCILVAVIVFEAIHLHRDIHRGGGRPGALGKSPTVSEAQLGKWPLVTTTFARDDDFDGPPSEKSAAAWDNLIPGYYALAVNGTLMGADATPESRAWNHTQDGHLDHCFDYLRQSLMCFADPTLEESPVHKEPGWNATHACNDWDRLFDWAKTNRYDDAVGIDTGV